jgi:hypothetical protein
VTERNSRCDSARPFYPRSLQTLTQKSLRQHSATVRKRVREERERAIPERSKTCAISEYTDKLDAPTISSRKGVYTPTATSRSRMLPHICPLAGRVDRFC